MPNTSVRISATIILPGDRSVGIPDGQITIDFGNWTSYAAFLRDYSEGEVTGREIFRKGIQQWADQWLQNCGPAKVMFNDESDPDPDNFTEEGKEEIHQIPQEQKEYEEEETSDCY